MMVIGNQPLQLGDLLGLNRVMCRRSRGLLLVRHLTNQQVVDMVFVHAGGYAEFPRQTP